MRFMVTRDPKIECDHVRGLQRRLAQGEVVATPEWLTLRNSPQDISLSVGDHWLGLDEAVAHLDDQLAASQETIDRFFALFGPAVPLPPGFLVHVTEYGDAAGSLRGQDKAAVLTVRGDIPPETAAIALVAEALRVALEPLALKLGLSQAALEGTIDALLVCREISPLTQSYHLRPGTDLTAAETLLAAIDWRAKPSWTTLRSMERLARRGLALARFA